MDKKLLDQIELWHQNNQHSEIVEMIGSIPKIDWEEEHYQRMASAKNNLEQYEEAIQILVEIEDSFTDKHHWYYKLGFAYYFKNEIERAYYAFQEALKYKEEDEDSLYFLDKCKDSLAIPIKDNPFSLRVNECWKVFIEKEEELRNLIIHKEEGYKISSYCEEILDIAFKKCYFELGFNGKKFELILSSEGDSVTLFKLIYFKNQAPQSIFENWNIVIGRQRSNEDFEQRMDDINISLKDISVFVENEDEDEFGITVYHKDIASLLKEDENKANSLVEVLLNQALGEVPAMKYITNLDIEQQPLNNETVKLHELSNYLQKQVSTDLLESWDDHENIYDSYTVYELANQESEESRSDIFVGSTSCPKIVDAYLSNDNTYEMMYDEDGANIGFVFYSLEGMESPVDFREEILADLAKIDDVVILGGATGTKYGYIDFISWDLFLTLNAIKEVFMDKGSLDVCYQRYRRDSAWVNLYEG